jgi:hypothetical protein
MLPLQQNPSPGQLILLETRTVVVRPRIVAFGVRAALLTEMRQFLRMYLVSASQQSDG